MYPLYVVGTPIGNLKDITLRALEVLRETRLILCERPRHTVKLLKHYDIVRRELLQYTEANKMRTIPRILERLASEPAALVVDAGTPAISDPGAELIRAVRQRGGATIPIPGPSALTAALSIAGLSNPEFAFAAFLPKSERALLTLLRAYHEMGTALIAYEAPHRITKTLARVAENFPHVPVTIFKELTKIHEKVISGEIHALSDALSHEDDASRGEYTVLFDFSATPNQHAS